MKYVKIRGNNYNEVMMKLKMEHGDEAIPISHKFVKEGGLFSSRLFAHEVVELTAAVQERKLKSSLAGGKKRIDFTVDDGAKNALDIASFKSNENIQRAAGRESPLPAKGMPERKPAGFSFSDTLNETYSDILAQSSAGQVRQDSAVPDRPAVMPAPEADGYGKAPEAFSEGNGRVEKELDEIKKAIYKMSTDRKPDGESLPAEEVNIRPFRKILKYNDFDDDQCSSIINEMKNSISREDLKDKYKIEKSLKDLLKNKIIVTGPIKSGSNKKKIVMFVGPTGVGKTTTMAKLGAINSLRECRSVSFVTIDNYRIAATEQLKKYAEIMNIPIYPVNNMKEFKDVIAADKSEIILVDTSGRSHRNDLKISEIKSFADAVDYDCEKILCVSANTKKSDLNDVFAAFDTIHFDSIIITKVDETSYIGNVVDIADKYSKPISYFTNGQEVPNDIIIADADKIVDMMIGNIYT
jgi:flagellar biosynthesis protein FlhF